MTGQRATDLLIDSRVSAHGHEPMPERVEDQPSVGEFDPTQPASESLRCRISLDLEQPELLRVLARLGEVAESKCNGIVLPN